MQTTEPIAAGARIAFLGLGTMGSGMAQTLLRGGFDVVGYDPAETARAAFERDTDTRTAASAEGAMRGAAAVVCMLPDGKVVRAALLGGERPAGAALAPGGVVLDCSSCAPTDTQALAPELAKLGIGLVDSPVSGGVKGTREGSLTLMVGGEERHVARVRPLLEVMGRAIHHVGPVGAGHAMKTLVNFIGTSQMLLDFQALLIGQRFGLKPEVMVEILDRSYAKNLSTEIVLRQQILSGAFFHNFTLALAAKDARIAAETAHAVGFGADTPAHFAKLLEDAIAALGAGADLTRTYTYFDTLWKAAETPQPMSTP
jgi:3-hydroxyisobutyrate dehydrogenase